MRLIEPTVELWIQDYSGDDPGRLITSPETLQETYLKRMYEHIEKCGRVCYKSEDRITPDSAKGFIEKLISMKHYAMLEHGTVYLSIPFSEMNEADLIGEDSFPFNRYVRFVEDYEDEMFYITTNYRVIVENNWQCYLEYMTPPREQHTKRYTAHFTCNRQVSHEFVRHRVFSFAQESTRYCNYSKGKFGGELTFIYPIWMEDPTKTAFDKDKVKEFRAAVELKKILMGIEDSYMRLLFLGWSPQQAANILPNALKTELVMTGYRDDWEHFFDLRARGTTGKPHPQAQELATTLMDIMNRLETEKHE